jgi:hypothetical protein
MDIAVSTGMAGRVLPDESAYLELPAWKAYKDDQLVNRISVDELADSATYGTYSYEEGLQEDF